MRYTTSYSYTTISGTTNTNGHHTTTIDRSKFKKTCRNRRIFRFYKQDYSGYIKDIKDYIYLNGGKYRPQDISPKKFSVL